MTAPLAGQAVDIGGKIGRSFNVTGMLPALFLVMWTYALINSEAWQSTPNLVALGARLSNLTLVDIALLLLASLLVGLFLHPLAFATIQLLEGYWGSSAFAVGARTVLGLRYRKKRYQFYRQHAAHKKALDKAFKQAKKPPEGLPEEQRTKLLNAYLNVPAADDLFRHVVARDALRHRYQLYPEHSHRMMPTRLGNALRRVEDRAGSQYGLNAIITVPHLALIAPEAHTAYLADTRRQLDTTAQLCSVSLFAVTQTVPALFTDGLWLLVALIPYFLAYLAYRAAIAAADQYGSAVGKIINLNRFRLYEELGLPKPKNTAQERATNKELMRLLDEQYAELSYEEEAVEKPEGPLWPG